LLTKKPWGWFVKLLHLRCFWIKIIRVRRGQRTSLQKHSERSELHVKLFPPSIRLYKRRQLHRMTEGLYIEFAWGKPIEDDIERVEDDYER